MHWVDHPPDHWAEMRSRVELQVYPDADLPSLSRLSSCPRPALSRATRTSLRSAVTYIYINRWTRLRRLTPSSWAAPVVALRTQPVVSVHTAISGCSRSPESIKPARMMLCSPVTAGASNAGTPDAQESPRPRRSPGNGGRRNASSAWRPSPPSRHTSGRVAIRPAGERRCLPRTSRQGRQRYQGWCGIRGVRPLVALPHQPHLAALRAAQGHEVRATGRNDCGRGGAFGAPFDAARRLRTGKLDHGEVEEWHKPGCFATVGVDAITNGNRHLACRRNLCMKMGASPRRSFAPSHPRRGLGSCPGK